MEERRKIRCDCGEYFQEGKAKVQGHYLSAMVCPKCGEKTFTLDQVKEGKAVLEMHEKLDLKKKISKVGNSLALLLPEGIKKLGMKLGTKVKIEAIDEKSFKVIKC
ncbi:hypothetical protein HZA97_03605 [Candidatus Woesearchaeota archaeon]|nr:hypothetical protein [Candidatus Woesearchaeota archaeon]